ncbi:BolA family protein [Methylococcus sp. EFPC2]|uniref:BolA family protein n=1 Tax=Methylococcus sp. EFPC2 TaxID=2812648 RepID=UPI001967874E|nr:BolA/IbaG family iron-sulfur metabolism protein [Methylococcus sp. EFPC2]QSA99233.1 BolA/IbaG family iron-sulfur metabolism protein [Methylococcus sp. EFPC2]
MEIAEVRQLIESGIPGSEVIVDGEGCSFSVVVVGEAFAGLSLVKRQQQVLATVSEPLSSGALHAISMKVYTSAEWAAERDKPAATA